MTPLVKFIFLITCAFILKIFILIIYDKAKIGLFGLYFATSLPVKPFSVMTIIRDALISEAVLTAEQQTASCVVGGPPVYLLIKSCTFA